MKTDRKSLLHSKSRCSSCHRFAIDRSRPIVRARSEGASSSWVSVSSDVPHLCVLVVGPLPPSTGSRPLRSTRAPVHEHEVRLWWCSCGAHAQVAERRPTRSASAVQTVEHALTTRATIARAGAAGTPRRDRWWRGGAPELAIGLVEPITRTRTGASGVQRRERAQRDDDAVSVKDARAPMEIPSPSWSTAI